MKINKETLISVLKKMVARIELDDSFEGRIEYSCINEECQKGEFVVKAAFRTGNSEGQGGMALIE